MEKKIIKNTISVKNRKINIIPLIDIIFLLLIFFMLATNFKQNQNIDFSMPKNQSETSTTDKMILELVIKNGGHFFFNDTLVETEANLQKEILSLWKSKKYSSILINTENDVYLQNLISTLDLLKSLGISEINFTSFNNEKN